MAERYTGSIGNIEADELDLLECLLRIDQGKALDSHAAAFLDRLIEAGLVDREDEFFSLTVAGIDRCKSLQYRVASDHEAARVLAARGLELARPKGDIAIVQKRGTG